VTARQAKQSSDQAGERARLRTHKRAASRRKPAGGNSAAADKRSAGSTAEIADKPSGRQADETAALASGCHKTDTPSSKRADKRRWSEADKQRDMPLDAQSAKTGESPQKAETAAKGDAKQDGKTRSKKQKVDPVVFWGDPALLPEPPGPIEPCDDIGALVSSLGRIPLAGRQTAAEHWLKLVYERAGVLAGVLAAAGGLSPDNSDEQPEHEG